MRFLDIEIGTAFRKISDKKKVVLISFLFFMTLKSCSTTSKQKALNEPFVSNVPAPPPPPIENLDTIYLNDVFRAVDVFPKFKGGETAFLDFVEKNIKNPYPEMDIEGTVWLSCVVEPDGTLSNIKVFRGVSGWNEEAMRVLKSSSGYWTAGTIDNKQVKIFMKIPIKCKIK